ncbi:MFS transporter [Latilactobacillus sakei]|uniref:MFS transporter n=1 Tax=Lactobacillaceae TaxID=33958 RepID=UPI000468B77F|nr:MULTISPECIES: MFS transporter [Lactobacillaceae]ARJ72132.1 MFS transporter [Latilactobacillus sakei]KRK69078.1 MFS transporter, SP family, inositol transporter [Latilactobacillus sakei subsp. sakei DSM 20017 = JCM 1157]MDG9751983.1 MFS transporter [Latilactobacillus sakei]MDH0601207.1 MFS transporter [Latilactobacillus sakei]MDN4010490.1 MFS transporter [Latilactobacillus sakei]
MPEKSKLKSVIAVSLTNYLDSGSIVAGASGLALWTKALGLSSFEVGLLGALSANAFGAAVGALIGGRLSDKYGRKFIYTYNMLVYMLGVLIVMVSFNFPMLLTGFMVTGISVGAGVPASWTYIAETSQSSNRAHNIGISQFAWSMGPAIIFVLGVVLSPLGLLGNRIIFGSLFVVALIAWMMQRGLEESSDWQEQKQKENASGIKPHPYKELFSNIVNVKTILYLIGVYALWNLAAGVQGFFMPYIYSTVGGLTNMQANLLSAVVWILTSMTGYFIFAKLGDRVSHRLMYGIGALMAMLAWVLITFGGMGWTTLWGFVLLWGLSAGFGAQAFYALWATELFPTRYRAGSQGVMFFVVRASAGIWSIIFPPIMASLGFKYAGTMIVIFLAISLVIGVIWAPHTRGKSLDEITEERYGSKK